MIKSFSLFILLTLALPCLAQIGPAEIDFNRDLNQRLHRAESTNPKVSCENNDIIGHWQFYKFIYEGQEHPPITPNLILRYNFLPNGVSEMSWFREGEKGLCERRGNYIYKDCFLMDFITWVNPKNSMDCGQDPDMRKGRQTITQLDIKNNEIRLHLSLGGKPFIYVWKKLP